MAKKTKRITNTIMDVSAQTFVVSSSAFMGAEMFKLSARRLSRKEKKQIKKVQMVSGVGMIASSTLMVAANVVAPIPFDGTRYTFDD